MTPKLNPHDIPAEVHAAVKIYLVTRAVFETLEPKVNTVYAQILDEISLYNDLEQRRNGDTRHQAHNTPDTPRRRLTSVKEMYLSENEEDCARVFDLAHDRLTAEGIKPADMDREKCPALVAYSVMSDAGADLVNKTAAMIGEKEDFRHRLLCSGMEKYQKFIDLAVGLVLAAEKEMNK
jgi:hypothetical protein